MTFHPAYVPWDRLSDIGEEVVGVFGLLLFVFCVFSLFCLGIRELFSHGYKRAKHKRRKYRERSA